MISTQHLRAVCFPCRLGHNTGKTGATPRCAATSKSLGKSYRQKRGSMNTGEPAKREKNPLQAVNEAQNQDSETQEQFQAVPPRRVLQIIHGIVSSRSH